MFFYIPHEAAKFLRVLYNTLKVLRMQMAKPYLNVIFEKFSFELCNVYTKSTKNICTRPQKFVMHKKQLISTCPIILHNESVGNSKTGSIFCETVALLEQNAKFSPNNINANI